MAVLACAYGVLKTGSIWYPINLLAATVYAQSLKLGPAATEFVSCGQLRDRLGLCTLSCPPLVGLLYGAMLPMFARRPIVLGGLIAPVLWSGLLYSMLGLLNPLLASHIDWFWFMASQVAFGVVAGFVVVRQSRVLDARELPFAMRAGVEAPGTIPPRRRENGRELISISVSSRCGWAMIACSRGCSSPHGQPGREFGDPGAE